MNGRARWDLWGPYLGERAWGTVREDYSANGDAWNYFPHDHARSRAYRWNEDGIGGISRFQTAALFRVRVLERARSDSEGASLRRDRPQGNHGEDVKELYWYIDNTPTHSFMRMIYRYPQVAFPLRRVDRAKAQRARKWKASSRSGTPAFSRTASSTSRSSTRKPIATTS